MFLDLNKTIKIIKQAYRTRLQIGNLEGNTIISSGYWAISIDNEKVPNKIKAIIMELAGELPRPGMLFEVNKSYPNPQILIDENTIVDILDNVKIANFKVYMTSLSVNNNMRLFQTQIVGGTMMQGISEDYLSIIDKTAIDYEIEGEPTGPCTITNHGGVYWYNSTGTVVIYPIKLKESPIFDALLGVDFSKEDK